MLDGSALPVGLVGVPAADFSARLGEFAPWLERIASGSDGKLLRSDISEAIRSREMQLWSIQQGPDVRGVVVTQVVAWPRLRALLVVGAVGRRSFAPFMATLEAWGRSQGCTIVHVPAARKWRHMLPGFTASHWLFEKAI